MFMFLILYFVISTPINTFFDTLDDADVAEANTYMDSYLPIIRNALTMAFAVTAAIPSTWFVIYVFTREPDWSYRRVR